MDEGRVRVVITPNLNGEVLENDELYKLMGEAGWTGDPCDGKTVLVPDERGAPGYEVFNPMPVANSVGWEPTPPIDELIRQRVKDEYARLLDDEEIDDIVDAEDFDIPDELPPLETIYEVMGVEEESPAEKVVAVSMEERIKDQLDYESLLERERAIRKRRSREEYDRRQREHEELYGAPAGVRKGVGREDEEGGH